MFFVISGYVLTRSWNGNFPAFLVRRFFRLWPVYALSLAVGGYMIGKAPPLSFYFWYPFEGIHGDIPYNPVMWSLFVEAWSALFMPIIVWIGQRSTPTAIAITALTAVQFVSKDVSYGAYFILGSYLSKFTFDEKYFSGAFTQWLGKISYSLYLTHLLGDRGVQVSFPRHRDLYRDTGVARGGLLRVVRRGAAQHMAVPLFRQAVGQIHGRYLAQICVRAAPVLPV